MYELCVIPGYEIQEESNNILNNILKCYKLSEKYQTGKMSKLRH